MAKRLPQLLGFSRVICRRSPRHPTRAHSSSAELPDLVGAAVSCITGARRENDDRWTAAQLSANKALKLFAVFDGTAGSTAAEFASAKLAPIVDSLVQDELAIGTETSNIDFPRLMSVAFTKLVDSFKSYVQTTEPGGLKDVRVGTTAHVVLLTPESIVFSSVGDSRGILIRDSELQQPLEEHRPDYIPEARRVMKAGGKVTFHGVPRVNGALAMTRCVGAFYLEPVGVVGEPDTTVVSRQPEDEYIILGTDGVFDFLTNEEVLRFAASEETAEDATQSVVMHAESYGSRDNLTAMIIPLRSWQDRTRPDGLPMRNLGKPSS